MHIICLCKISLICFCIICVGFVYGAKENKKLRVFIDDVNLPVMDNFGVQRCNEVKYFYQLHHEKIFRLLF